MAAEGEIEVLIIDKTIYLKPTGLATRDICMGLPDFLRTMFRHGCLQVAIDLKDCLGMDSTFLGVVADAATSLRSGPPKTVAILNADGAQRQELRTVGLLALVAVHEEPYELPSGVQFRRINFLHFPLTRTEELERIKHLHEELVKLNEANRRLFGGFIEMLEAELRADENAEGT